MGLSRLIRRFHAPLAGVAIACVLSLSVGCRSGTEAVGVPPPQRAVLAEDGSVLLAVHVERELQPERSGWHWVIVEPETAEVLIGEAPFEPRSPSTKAVWVAYLDDGDEPDAQMVPPLLEAGLPEPVLPEGYTELRPLTLSIAGEEWGNLYMLGETDETGPDTPMFRLWPSEQAYRTPGRRLLDGAGDVLTAPLFAVGVVIVAGYLLLYIAFDDSGRSPI